MRPSCLFIDDVQTFENTRSAVKSSFLIDAELPDQVFQDSFRYFAFEEFLWMMSAEGWSVLHDLARSSDDQSLLMTVLDPKPDSYYKKEFGYYNWASLPASISGDGYWSFLNEHPSGYPADSLLVNSKTVAWLPPSGAWAIWGERSYGICVLGHRKQIAPGSWQNIDWALESCLPANFAGGVVPQRFQLSFRANFGSQF